MNETKKKIAGNTIYTISGNLVMNGVLQIVIYPLLNRVMGAEPLGNLLFIMGIAAIICPSVGQALNTSRLVVRREYPVSNGDYNTLLLLSGGLGCVVTLLLARNSVRSVLGGILISLLLLATLFRYYGDVEYRLSLHYKGYLVYYLILAAGYLAGFGLYLLTDVWYLIFLTGEAAAFFYVLRTGSIYDHFFACSDARSVAWKRGMALIGSYLITNLTLNIDRLALKFMLGDTAVTQYYVVSLIGKTMVLLVAPVNTIIISYLTKEKEQIGQRQFLKFVAAGAGTAFAFWIMAQIGTPIFVRLFYPDLYEATVPVMTIVNISQILGLLSAYLFIVVLSFTDEKLQLVLQGIHLVLIVILVNIFTSRYQLPGFSAAVLAANAIRVLLIVLVGFYILNKRKQEAAA